MFTLRTLGQLGVFDAAGAPVRGAAGQRKPLALLALLTAHPDQGFTRERIAAYLWPELDEERSRQALRQTLYALRRDLGAADLFLDGPVIRVNPEILTSDVASFWAADAARDWALMVDLRRGPFLDGFYLDSADEFERWAEVERAGIEKRYRTALASMATAAQSAADHSASAEWWRRLTAVDPLDGRAVVGLMQALDASGAPGPALECAREHEVRLRSELGTGPDPGVVELAAEIRGRMQRSRPAQSADPEPPVHAPSLPPVQVAPAAIAPPPRRRGISGPTLAVGLGVLALIAGRIALPPADLETAEPRSVAIMTLRETSTENEGPRIGAALSEELARLLGHAGSLRVLGPGATRPYRDSTNRLELLGSELGAESVVDGTVERIGDQVDLTVRLRAVPSGQELWSFHNRGPSRDLVAVQASVSSALAGRLRGKLSASESELVGRRPTAVPEAYDHFLRASTLDQGNREENEAGIRILRQAIATDSTFALAYATLARRFTFNGFLVSPGYLDSGLVVARRALELDPNLALAHFALGDLLVLSGKPVTARFSYLRALELNPNEIGAMADLSDADALTGRLDESLYWGLRALALAPTAAPVHAHAIVPLCHMAADETAARWLAEGVRRWPNHLRHQHLLMRQELVTGQDSAALARARLYAARDPGDEETQIALAGVAYLVNAPDAEALVTSRYRLAPDSRPYGPSVEGPRAQLAFLRMQAGDSATARRLADTALMRAERDFRRGGEDPLPAVEAAALHTLLGRQEKAMEWLGQAHRIGWKDYRYARKDPLLAPLRSRPDFRELLAQMEAETTALRRRAMATSPAAFGGVKTASR
jgi:DNA-binding SARP family transcriptional activator/TolB-like protein